MRGVGPDHSAACAWRSRAGICPRNGESRRASDTCSSSKSLAWAPGTQFYDNVDGFFETALTQKHNLSFSGATADSRVNYRLATSITRESARCIGREAGALRAINRAEQRL